VGVGDAAEVMREVYQLLGMGGGYGDIGEVTVIDVWTTLELGVHRDVVGADREGRPR
jgi:hypothetical protein